MFLQTHIPGLLKMYKQGRKFCVFLPKHIPGFLKMYKQVLQTRRRRKGIRSTRDARSAVASTLREYQLKR